MRTIIFVALIALSFSSTTFLRNLAQITIKGFKSPAVCIGVPSASSIYTFGTTCSGQTDTSQGQGENYRISFVEKTTSGTPLTSGTTCTQGASENADLTCKLTDHANVQENKIYIIKADAGSVGSADSVNSWSGITVGVTSKEYVALGTQTTQELKYEDDKFNFTVVFAAELKTDIPKVTVNSTVVDCSVMTDKKKLTCLMKKDKFKEEDEDKPYIATITSICGVDEAATVTITASASFYNFSKIALAIIAFFLF